jgi:hypothetical protein
MVPDDGQGQGISESYAMCLSTNGIFLPANGNCMTMNVL